MSWKPYKPGKALLHAVLLWIVGFVWGTMVFMTPGLKSLPEVPYISKYPAVSAPLIADYFAYLSIWFYYAMAVAVPWYTGRRLERK